MAKVLEVRGLRISFRTNHGNVRAVRDISFDLEKGETLAIVGESGSGKSVTAKAILGILAANKIVEGGEIIYNGEDLLKYTEKDFNQIRGNKFSMIFQDPLSSLDPIMKIGKQMTEATILNGKTNQKMSGKEYKAMIKLLKKNMVESGTSSSEASRLIRAMNQEMEADAKKQKAYLDSLEYMESALLTVDQLSVNCFGDDNALVKQEMDKIADKLKKADVPDQPEGEGDLKQALSSLKDAVDSFLQDRIRPAQDPRAQAVKDSCDVLKTYLLSRIHGDEPDFYAGLAGIDGLFAAMEKAIVYADKSHIQPKEEAVKALKAARPVFEAVPLDKKAVTDKAKELYPIVDKSIDKMNVRKDSDAYTFHTSMRQEIERYFAGVKKNPKEEKRVIKETAKREKKIAKHQEAPKVVPAQVVDLELTQANILRAIDRVIEHYEREFAEAFDVTGPAEREEFLEHVEALKFAEINKVTKTQAYDKAIRIMEEVGIKEAEKRFTQYPFEFSGGMRQRIVIAIAVAANPDILICDEPTTALDVTIQSQILELINDIKRKRNISVIFITHDLGVVANIADTVAVMYAGKIVEYGKADDIFYDPKHPYTWALLGSMPDLDTKDKLEAIPGTPPNMIYPPAGDAFAERNQYAMQIDFEQQPPMFKVSDTHYAATWLLHPDAPHVDPPKIVTDRIERMKKLEVEANAE